MTGPEERIAAHYGGAGLYERIMAALNAAGITENTMTAAHLTTVDEFHIGGAEATAELLDQLRFEAGARVLDIGSGIGGPARFIRTRYGASVTGIDLTPDFVETARRLSAALGVEAAFHVGSALDLPFEDESFDVATLIHVGMNLPDKPRLFSEAARVLREGGVFAVYDVMRFGAHPAFPVPWASDPEASFLDTPEAYEAAAAAAGFTRRARRERGDMARDFFARMKARMETEGPATVGLPILMGPDAPVKVSNMIAAVGRGDIAPVEMIFEKSRGG